MYLGKRDFVDHVTHVDPIGKEQPFEKKEKILLCSELKEHKDWLRELYKVECLSFSG